MVTGNSTTGLAVVVGAGTMGVGIAAQLANAGWHVRLLDVLGLDPASRDAVAQGGIERLAKSRPPLLFLPEYASRIETGNTTDDLDCMTDADWIVEAIVEKMAAKQDLLTTIEAHAGPNTVVTSNTSGLNLGQMSAKCGAAFRTRFFGTHFLNPPRYLKLLEVAPTSEVNPQIHSDFICFAEQVLGHRVVTVRDTPGFISTRIWIQHLLQSIRIAAEMGLTVEETDYLTGKFLGRPKSGTFRMADIVGLDIVCAVAANQFASLPDDPFCSNLVPPDALSHLAAQGQLGEKTGAGFYKRQGREILSFDLSTREYRSRIEPEFPEFKSISKYALAHRLSAISADRNSRQGRFLNTVLDSLHNYVQYAGPRVSDDVAAVDNVMKWGFQWEMGPYEIEDLRHESPKYYGNHGTERTALHFADTRLKTVVTDPQYVTLADLKSQGRTVLEAPEGTLVDMGDGVACIEMHTKMNTFGPPLCDFIDRARECAEHEFRALVIGSDAPYFSAGFNLKLFLEAAPNENWDAIDAMLHQVQNSFMALKYSPIPSVAAVRGYTLGGGCECAFACSAIQAAPELVMGLPELPAGLIPSGGAFKELLIRTFVGWDGQSDAFTRADSAASFIIGYPPTTSTNAHQAKEMGLLRETDGISRNGDRLLYDARERSLALANSGYAPPVKRGVWAVGAPGLARMRLAINEHFNSNRRITEHDRLIANSAAYVMCGGSLSASQEVSEQYMLNLERDAFLKLVREPKTLARIKYLLETGRPLSN